MGGSVTYLIVSNGVGQKPHIEEVDSVEDVTERIARDADAFVVIEGRIVPYHKESFVFLDSEHARNITHEQEGADGRQCIPRWRAPATRETEHLPVVEEHPGREEDDTPGDSVDEGSDAGGAGEDSDSSADDVWKPE